MGVGSLASSEVGVGVLTGKGNVAVRVAVAVAVEVIIRSGDVGVVVEDIVGEIVDSGINLGV